MGEVWAATHLVTERRVAMKFVATSLRLTDRLRERLFREARAAGRVKHPGVIEIVDAFTTDDDVPVIVMELLEGEPLARRLRREGGLPLAEAADILLQVVSAVGAVHERGIVHRDLKPENVFLCEAENGPCMKVLDFGVAKLAGPREQNGGLTSVGQVLGTPAYMAPEQCRGERDIDHRADVWAIGIMIYELLSGERPIDGDTVGEVVESLLTEGVPPLRLLVPDAPFDLAVMARRMLERERKQRPEDLRAVAAVLRNHTVRDWPVFGPAGSKLAPEESDRELPSGVEQSDQTLAPAERTLRERGRKGALFLPAALLIVVGALVWSGISRDDSASRRDESSAAPNLPSAAVEPNEPPSASMGVDAMPTASVTSTTPSDEAVPAAPKVLVRPRPVPVTAPVAAVPQTSTSAAPSADARDGPKVQDWD